MTSFIVIDGEADAQVRYIILCDSVRRLRFLLRLIREEA